MWDVNECNTANPEADTFFRELAGLIRKNDPSRLVSYAALYGIVGPLADIVNVLGINSYWGWYDKIFGGKGLKPESDEWKKESNVHMEPIDLVSMRQMLDKVISEGHKNLAMLLTEFGADSVAGYYSKSRDMWSENYHADLLREVFKLASDYPQIVGTFPFCFSDYRDPSKVPNGYWNELKNYVIVSPSKGCVELQEYEIGDPGASEIQVRVHVSLISPGTERAEILGMANTPGTYPFAPGYCSAGVVEKVGADVTRFSAGDRVASFFMGHRSIGNMDESAFVKIPEGVSFEEAAFLSLAQIAMQGVRKARIELGEKAMVIGLGIIGQLALQFARQSGALPVIGVDRIESRLKLALECGADEVINASRENWMGADEEKPQVVIESTGAADAVATAFQAAHTFGRVSLLGSTRGESTVNFYKDVHCKAITILGAHAYFGIPQHESRPGYWNRYDDAGCFMGLLKQKRICLNPLITNRIKWENAVEAYNKILACNSSMIGTVINWI